MANRQTFSVDDDDNSADDDHCDDADDADADDDDDDDDDHVNVADEQEERQTSTATEDNDSLPASGGYGQHGPEQFQSAHLSKTSPFRRRGPKRSPPEPTAKTAGQEVHIASSIAESRCQSLWKLFAFPVRTFFYPFPPKKMRILSCPFPMLAAHMGALLHFLF